MNLATKLFLGIMGYAELSKIVQDKNDKEEKLRKEKNKCTEDQMCKARRIRYPNGDIKDGYDNLISTDVKL